MPSFHLHRYLSTKPQHWLHRKPKTLNLKTEPLFGRMSSRTWPQCSIYLRLMKHQPQASFQLSNLNLAPAVGSRVITGRHRLDQLALLAPPLHFGMKKRLFAVCVQPHEIDPQHPVFGMKFGHRCNQMVHMSRLNRFHQRHILNRCRFSHLLNVRLLIQGVHHVLLHILHRLLWFFFFWMFRSLFNIFWLKITDFMPHQKFM